ncbi:MAG: exodeoxyribonuclease III [Propionibacterium sp.]|nr:exodeoxyribonuclease III [Propionibacterium sp.]
MRIATHNVNGIRAALRRGVADWLTGVGPDVVAQQEVRCPIPALPPEAFRGYWAAYDSGARAGRNGVAVLTRERPQAVRTWGTDVVLIDPIGRRELLADDPVPLARELRRFDTEGRYLEVDLADRPLTVASLYLPKGGSPFDGPEGLARFERKMRFMTGFARQLARSRRTALASGREFLVMGDFNIAHTELDVKNWRRATKSEGFLPAERAWIDTQISPRTLVDVVRRVHPDAEGPYSWWSWLGQSFTHDVGWRIDYHLATPRLARSATAAWTAREASYEERMSDHAPVVVDYAW